MLKTPAVGTESVVDATKYEYHDGQFEPEGYNKYMDINQRYEKTINSWIEKADVWLWICKGCGNKFVSKSKTGLKVHIEISLD